MFLDLEGIEGEARDKTHAKKIDILAWSWGMSQSGNMHIGGGGGAGKVHVQDISITKYVDRASTNVVKYCTLGTHIPKGEIIIRKAGGTAVEYLKIQLTDIIVTSWSTGGSGGEDRLTENLTLQFAEFNIDYVGQDAKGAPVPKMSASYNMAENATG